MWVLRGITLPVVIAVYVLASGKPDWTLVGLYAVCAAAWYAFCDWRACLVKHGSSSE